MNQNQQFRTPMPDDLASPVTVDGTILEESTEYDWDPLTIAVSWESEPPFMGGAGAADPSFSHLSLSPPPASNTDPPSQFGSTLNSRASIYDGAFSPGDMTPFPWHQYSSLVTNAADLMKMHEKQVAAKRERRKVQNRKAQQAYRERREQQVEVLRLRIEAAEKQCENQAHQIESLQGELAKLKGERQSLLQELRRPSLPSSNPSGSSTDTIGPDEDDLLSYATSRRFSL